uniref:Uncharacterized protein n=1 Tax=Periophthalmus magnuspinnatus TaxID=409849 RepID=A0A3B4B9X5_9GOBI
VMKSTGPVYGDVRLLFVQLHGSNDKRHVSERLLCDGSYSPKVCKLTSLHLFAVFRHVVRSDGPQELYVIVTVVFGHLLAAGFVRSLQTDLHFPVEAIVQEEVVRHADSVRLHGMTLRDIVPPVCPGSSPGPPPSGTCLKHLSREASRRHHEQMPEPPPLQLYSELLPCD